MTGRTNESGIKCPHRFLFRRETCNRIVYILRHFNRLSLLSFHLLSFRRLMNLTTSVIMSKIQANVRSWNSSYRSSIKFSHWNHCLQFSCGLLPRSLRTFGGQRKWHLTHFSTYTKDVVRTFLIDDRKSTFLKNICLIVLINSMKLFFSCIIFDNLCDRVACTTNFMSSPFLRSRGRFPAGVNVVTIFSSFYAVS